MLPEPFAHALDHHKARHEPGPEGGEYLRLTDDVRGHPRGTLLWDGLQVVYGYPHIGRILQLETGLAQQFSGPFWVEEKVDGYNVRVARLGEQVLAFTRGGFVCPFTTDRLPDLLDLTLFDDHPEVVVCAEVAGPDQPYVVGHPPQVRDDVALFVFDLMRVGEPGFLPDDELGRLAERYGLPRVSRFGRLAPGEWRQVGALVRALNDERREGVVLKEVGPPGRRAKYVTGASCIDDILATVDNLPQLPAEYFTGRVLRLALFLAEQGEAALPGAREQLGQAFVDGLLAALGRFQREHRVYHTHRCRFRRRESAERLMAHLRRHEGPIQVMERRLEHDGEHWVLEFEKVYAGMTGLLGHLLAGGIVFD
jgi:putative ATP-dependent DNA ligase